MLKQMKPATIGSAEFFARTKARLNFDVPPGLIDPNIIPRTGDEGNDRMLEIVAVEQPVRPAAVLIPVVDHPEPTVLLTQRSEHLSSHAGQISFPGGKIDATDASPMDAALREAHEEVGLKRDFIEPIGYLDLYGTAFGFRILPTVARVKPGFELKINEGEVVDAFEVPLAFLMNLKTTRSTPRNSAAWSAAITRCRSPSVTSGARPRASCGYCTSGYISHDPSGTDRNRNLPDPFRGLCAVPACDPFRRAGAIFLAGASRRQARAGVAAAGDRQFHHARAFQRGAAGFDVHPRPHRERQVRAGG
jgi:8-oxo-dGTP pyrophosphatase MutT (NUDIX family)